MEKKVTLKKKTFVLETRPKKVQIKKRKKKEEKKEEEKERRRERKEEKEKREEDERKGNPQIKKHRHNLSGS